MKKNILGVFAVMAAFTLFTVSCGGNKKAEDKKTQETEVVEEVAEEEVSALDEAIEKESASLPKQMAEGLSVVKLANEDGNVAIYLEATNEIYQQLASLGVEGNKAQMIEGFKSDVDPLQQAAIDEGAGVNYTFTNVETGEAFEFAISPEEIAAAVAE